MTTATQTFDQAALDAAIEELQARKDDWVFLQGYSVLTEGR